MSAICLRSLLSIFCLLASLLGAASAHAGDFKPGGYSYTDKDGVKVWQLHFAQDPKVRTYYHVTGSVGSIVRVPVRGGYSGTNNRLSASWVPVPGTPFGLADISGEWHPDSDTFTARFAGGPPINLKFDLTAPDPTAPKIAITNVELEPAIHGALLKGRVTVRASQLKTAAPAMIALSIRGADRPEPTERRYATTQVEFARDGEQVIDFSHMPVTVPVLADMARVVVEVEMLEADPTYVQHSVDVPVAGQKRPVIVDNFYSDSGSAVIDAEEIGWRYSLRSIPDATGERFRAQVFETVTVTPIERPAEAVKSPAATYDLPCSSTGETTPPHKLAVKSLQPGYHDIIVRIEGPDVQTYHGVFRVLVEAPRTTNTPKEEDPATLTGSATMGQTSLKPKERTSLTVRYGYEKGPDAVDVDAEFQIIDPKGKVTSTKKRVDLRKGKSAEHRFNVDSETPGVHTVKVRVAGEKCNPWTTSTTFTVEKPEAPPAQPKPPPNQRGDAAQQGTFGLVKRVVGKAPDAGDGPYGVMTGSIAQTSCSFQYVMKAPYVGNFTAKATFSTPAAVLKPGDIIELTCSGSATESGKDLPYLGITCGWGADGSCEVIEGRRFFVGKASDGTLHSSGQATFKVKVGSGGKVVLVATQGGMAWGTGAVWDPCEYTYDWNAPPIEPSDEGAGKDGAGTEKPGEDSQGATLTSTDPDDEQSAQIRAWLDPGAITLYAGEVSKIVNISMEGFRTNTLDRVEVIFPQKTDDWASLPGQIVVGGGNGSYDPANMGRPVHADGYFFSARETAPGGEYEIDIIVRQKGAGFERLKLAVRVVPKPPKPPQDPGAGGGAGGQSGGGNPPGRLPLPPPTGKGQQAPQGDPTGPAQNFAGRWTTNFGPITLTQRDNIVEGTYPGGVIGGTVAGNTLTLRVDEPALSPFPGFGRWVLNAKGDEFNGALSPAQDLSPPLRVWNGMRVTTGGASPNRPDPRGAEPTDPAWRRGDPAKPGDRAKPDDPTKPRDPGAQHKPGTPGPTDQPFEIAELGLKLSPPNEWKMIFHTSDLTMRHPGTVVEFRFENANYAPTVSGAILRRKTSEDVKTFADRRENGIGTGENFEQKVERITDVTLERKPGQWLMREYKLSSQFATFLERHVWVSDGAGAIYELVFRDNIRGAEASRPVMDQLTANLSIASLEK